MAQRRTAARSAGRTTTQQLPQQHDEDPFASEDGEYLKNEDVAHSGERFTVTGIEHDEANMYKGKPAPRWLVFIEGSHTGILTFRDNPKRNRSFTKAKENLPIIGARLLKDGQAYRLTTN